MHDKADYVKLEKAPEVFETPYIVAAVITPCIEGGALDKYGYSQVFRDGRCQRAHRYAVEQIVGPLPQHLEVHHRCENGRCRNLFHLDIRERRRHRRLHQVKAICKRGHDASHRNQWGTCRACRRELDHARV